MFRDKLLKIIEQLELKDFILRCLKINDLIEAPSGQICQIVERYLITLMEISRITYY